jgi:LPXTG-site transpeptidase (sortase) family protein
MAVTALVITLTSAATTPESGRSTATAPAISSTVPATAAPSSPTPTSPAAPNAGAVVVPGAPPLHLSVAAAGIDAAVVPYTVQEAAEGFDGVTGRGCLRNEIIRCIDPRSTTEVSWQVAGLGGIAFGDQPGSDTSGTVYFYGHTSAGANAVFNNIDRLQPGDVASVTTTAGVLRYRVQRTVDIAKSKFTSSPQALDQVPGRLLLISCDHRPGAGVVNGGYSTGNLVVILQREVP